MSTLSELLAQRSQLDQQIAQVRAEAREAALQEIREIMQRLRLTTSDLGAGAGSAGAARGAGRKRGPGMVSKVAPKYRDPETGATWSGRGLKPKWVQAKLASGKTLQDLAI